MTLLLPTKFYPPPAPAGFVARPQLFAQLDEALTHRLTLVSAPAGAGKTVLVSAWSQAKRQGGAAAFGWLSLDDADNAPGRFWEYLAACLEEGGAGVDSARFQPENGETSYGESVPAGLIRGWLNLKGELILILDDYHLIQNKEIHAALGNLLEHTPPRLHLVLLTRSDPPLELARLRVSGQLAEIRMEQLRFSSGEAAAFLKKAAGVQLSETEAATLNARAEGWAAGLQMAAISLRGRSDAGAFVAAFAGSHRFVFDYLLEQVLSRQKPEIREFLLKTSVLERFCAPLCAAVAGTEIARQFLDIMEHDNLFLVPLDDERGWYRYHHLFADLLKLMLEQTHPGLAAELHRRASCWHETQGLIPEALAHALAADDMELAARLVSTNVLALVERAELAPILLLMESAPRAEREAQPWLEVAYAWGLAYIGQNEQADLALSQAEQQMDGLASDKRNKLLGHIAAVRAYVTWTKGEHSEAVDFARQAESLLPLDELAIRALNLTTLGNALIQLADDPHSAEALEKAFLLAQQVRQAHVVMQAASGLAYTCAILGKYRRAREVCEQALGIAEVYQRNDARPVTAAASVYAILSRIWFEAGEFEKALEFARKGLALSELWGQVDTIMLCYLYLTQALTFTNQPGKARETLQIARKIAQKASPWHLANVDEAELETYLDLDPHGSAEIQREAAHKQEIGRQRSGIAPVRVLLKKNRPAEALALLEEMLAEPGLLPTYRNVRLYALKAQAYFQNKDSGKALPALEKALEQAEPENRVATFIREGESMEKLLRSALAKSRHPDFTRKLLSVFETLRQPQSLPAADTLIEPLSERELEILSLLDGPLSTPEIAERLVVSANTVRTHVKNIYGKLGVHGRSGAVKRAQELNLLA